jgi:hypothetical protein
LPLANPSHCRADSGLSPYRTCAHRAHTRNGLPAQHFEQTGHFGLMIWKNRTSNLCECYYRAAWFWVAC